MPTNLDALLGKMYTKARDVYDRAVANATQLGHGAVGDTHLLLGILAAGNSDPGLPAARILREAGADYQHLRTFLASHTELCSPPLGGRNNGPQADDAARRTLARARHHAKKRHSNHESYGIIITSDLVVGLLGSHDPLFWRALEYMEVDVPRVRRQYASANLGGGTPSGHLHAIK